MFGYAVAILALGALCAAWVVVQQLTGCEGGGNCRACTCRPSLHEE